MATLRQRNRLRAMRETQRTALALFEQRGFDRVTVDVIAETVGVAASTVYRHFGTKEDIVLWDEHESVLDQALEARLGRQPPFEALRDAFVETLASRYDADLEFQLARVRFIYATGQLHAAAVEADFRARTELTRAIEGVLSPDHKPAAPIVAGAALVALDVAIDEWQQREAREPLGELIAAAFDRLARVSSLA